MADVQPTGPDSNPGIPSPEPAPARSRRARRAVIALAALVWAYLAFVVALWLFLYVAADRWWLGTIAMYGPRWVWAAPLAVLLPAAVLVRRRRVLLTLLLAALVLLGPVMRFCVPWRRAFAAHAEPAARLRLLTCNIDGTFLDPSKLRAFIDQTDPDVVAFQTWLARQQRAVFGKGYPPPGWHTRRDGELFVASRHPIVDARTTYEAPFDLGNGALASYDIQTPSGTVRLINLHLATPRRGLLAFVEEGLGAAGLVRQNVDLRRRQTEVARGWVDEALRGGVDRVVVAGDFNTTTDSAIYRTYWPDLTNAYSTTGFGFGNTHFTQWTAIRIDHVLVAPGLGVERAWVGPHVGAGHRPLVADLHLRNATGASATHAAAAP